MLILYDNFQYNSCWAVKLSGQLLLHIWHMLFYLGERRGVQEDLQLGGWHFGGKFFLHFHTSNITYKFLDHHWDTNFQVQGFLNTLSPDFHCQFELGYIAKCWAVATNPSPLITILLNPCNRGATTYLNSILCSTDSYKLLKVPHHILWCHSSQIHSAFCDFN